MRLSLEDRQASEIQVQVTGSFTSSQTTDDLQTQLPDRSPVECLPPDDDEVQKPTLDTSCDACRAVQRQRQMLGSYGTLGDSFDKEKTKVRRGCSTSQGNRSPPHDFQARRNSTTWTTSTLRRVRTTISQVLQDKAAWIFNASPAYKDKPDIDSLSPDIVAKLMAWRDRARRRIQFREKTPWLLLPTSRITAVLDSINMVLLLWTFFEIPFMSVFGGEIVNSSEACAINETGFGTTNLVVDILFMCDVVATFNTAYYDSDLNLELNRLHIAKNYLRGWFAVDFFTSLPIAHLLCSLGGSSDAAMMRTIKMLRLLKLSRVVRISKILSHWELRSSSGKTASLLRLTKFVVIIFLATHVAGCVWASHAMPKTTCDPDLVQGCQCTEQECYPTNWLLKYDQSVYESNRVSSKYLASIYFAIVTLSTVGFGDITPSNDGERVTAGLFALLGACVFAWCISSISEIANKENKMETTIKESVRDVSDFMQYMNLPRELQIRVRRQILHHAKSSPFLLGESLVGLPENLKKEIFEMIVSRHSIANISWFEALDKDCRSKMIQTLRPMILIPGQFVCHAMDSAQEMYFVISGSLAVMDIDEAEVLDRFGPGDFLGDISMFNEGLVVRTASIRALTRSEIMVLSRFDLHNVIKPNFPDLFQSIKDIAMTRLSFVDKNLISSRIAEVSLKRCHHFFQSEKEVKRMMRMLIKKNTTKKTWIQHNRAAELMDNSSSMRDPLEFGSNKPRHVGAVPLGTGSTSGPGVSECGPVENQRGMSCMGTPGIQESVPIKQTEQRQPTCSDGFVRLDGSSTSVVSSTQEMLEVRQSLQSLEQAVSTHMKTNSLQMAQLTELVQGMGQTVAHLADDKQHVSNLKTFGYLRNKKSVIADFSDSMSCMETSALGGFNFNTLPPRAYSGSFLSTFTKRRAKLSGKKSNSYPIPESKSSRDKTFSSMAEKLGF